MNKTIIQRLLSEVQAYVGAARYSPTKSLPCVLEWLTKSPRLQYMRRHYTADALHSAYDDVRCLYAMGCADEEIGALVKKSHWEGKQKRFDTLANRVATRMEELNITEVDLDNLVSLDELRRRRYVRRVKMIAQEELIRASQRPKR